MIHQFIFASPRPGMSEEAFQRYWVEIHAVRYASRIPQIRRYMIDTRIPLPGETAAPLWGGVAEIWLANAEEQLASLQTPEFLQGARADEPNWAAFWLTRGLDTTAHEILPGPPDARDNGMAKLLILSKRREGLPRCRHSRTTAWARTPPRCCICPGCAGTLKATWSMASIRSARRRTIASSSCGSTASMHCSKPAVPWSIKSSAPTIGCSPRSGTSTR